MCAAGLLAGLAGATDLLGGPHQTASNYGTTVGQDVYHGNSLEQLDGLVDLLANFDEFTKRGRSIKSMVKVEPPPPAAKPEDKDEKEEK